MLLLLAGIAFTPAVPAVETPSLYSAQVSIDPQQPDARDSAYSRALQQVLIRITGSEAAAFSPELRALFPNPARYVLQFRPGENSTLWVTLDGPAIERVLRGAGQPVWGSDRPLTVVWLAVDWGRGDRELLTAPPGDALNRPPNPEDRAQRLRQRVAQVAEARGVPVIFPGSDDIDPDEISFSDVWGGFHDRLVAASRGYGATSVLVGRLRPDAAERNRWSYYFGGQQRQWSGDPEDALHLLADTLAGEFAFAGNAPVQAVAVTVSNVASVQAYAAVQQVIGGLEMIDGYRIDEVSGDRIRYLVRINGGAQRLASVLGFQRELQRVVPGPGGNGDPSADALAYVYSP